MASTGQYGVKMNIEKLHNDINSITPIVGVSIGREDDKSTWKVHFPDHPTPEQLSIVENAIANFVDEPEDNRNYMEEALILILENLQLNDAEKTRSRDLFLNKLKGA